jgi:hypothetical protein
MRTIRPLATFEPGVFVVSVEAISARESDAAPIVRRVPFTVTAVDPQ